MRVSVEPGESSVKVKLNGAEVGIARPGAEVNVTVNAGDNVEIEGFDEAEGGEAQAETAADDSNKTGGEGGEQS